MTVDVIRESHEPSPEVAAVLRNVGGSNPYGSPMYRAIWSNTRLDWCKGDEGWLARRPKYWHKPDRWIIEKWLPPSIYERGSWDEDELGPFPSHGDYECSFVVEDEQQQFIQLTEAIARELILRIRVGESLSDWQRLAALRRRDEKREAEQDRIRHEVFSNQPTIYTGSYVTVPQNFEQEKV
jgi:hypothetical protein